MSSGRRRAAAASQRRTTVPNRAQNRFQNKVAIVTGASSGIGRATALALGAEGANVTVTARRPERLGALAKEIERAGGGALPLAGDVTDADFRSRVVDETVSRFGGLDHLVNSAGVIAFGTIENTALDAWQRMFALNVEAVFDLMRLSVPHLLERQGSIVNVSSVNGIRSFPGVLAYNSSKSALDQLTRCSALELAAKGVRVNSVNPGVTRTELHTAGGLDDERYAAFVEHSKTTHPIGRIGRPEEVAALALFLLSDEAGFCTGVPVDGGRHHLRPVDAHLAEPDVHPVPVSVESLL